MKRNLLIVGALVLFAGPASPQTETQTGEFLRSNPKFMEAFSEVVEPHAGSVVRIQCDGRDTCLGIVAGADGWILAKADDLMGKIACKLPNGQTHEAKIVGIHEQHDVALLQIAAKDLRPLPFADARSARSGAWVASVGFGGAAAAVGVVSVPTRKLREAYLGITADASAEGIIVVTVARNSAALKVGLRARDVIVSINGVKVTEPEHFQQILGARRPGDTIELRVRRGESDFAFSPVLQSREQAGDFRSEFQNRLGSDLSNRRNGYAIVLQHDSILRPSDCGGPLVDLRGRVVGINISRAGRVETLALPAEIVPPLFAELKSGKLAPKQK